MKDNYLNVLRIKDDDNFQLGDSMQLKSVLVNILNPGRRMTLKKWEALTYHHHRTTEVMKDNYLNVLRIKDDSNYVIPCSSKVFLSIYSS